VVKLVTGMCAGVVAAEDAMEAEAVDSDCVVVGAIAVVLVVAGTGGITEHVAGVDNVAGTIGEHDWTSVCIFRLGKL
jgi:hypothetical protein